jgi:hypothetical protein
MPSIIQHQEQTSYHIFNPNLLSCMPANCILELGMIPLSIWEHAINDSSWQV